MKKRIIAAPFLLLATIVSGCDESFNPNGSYKEQLVVYAALTSRSDTQFVRVYLTSPPEGTPAQSPGGREVPDARVAIRQGGTEFVFRDTTIKRSDTSRYRTDIRAYVSYGFRLDEAKVYQLSVVSPTKGSVQAQSTSLYRGSLAVENPPPYPAEDIHILAYLSADARAYIVRFYIDYEVRNNGRWEGRRTEVPALLRQAGGSNTLEPVFPRLIFLTRIGRGAGNEPERLRFSYFAYAQTLAGLRAQYPGSTLRYRRAVFTLTQVDEPLYAYYSVVNGFPDAATIRLDEPNYTNIIGGLGVFGTITEAQNVVALPDSI